MSGYATNRDLTPELDTEDLSNDTKLLCQVVPQEQIEHVHCPSGQKSPTVPKTKAVPPGQHFPTLSGSRPLDEPIRINHMSYANAGKEHEECDDNHQFPRVPRDVVVEGYHAAHSRAKLGFRQSRPSSYLAEPQLVELEPAKWCLK